MLFDINLKIIIKFENNYNLFKKNLNKTLLKIIIKKLKIILKTIIRHFQMVGSFDFSKRLKYSRLSCNASRGFSLILSLSISFFF